MASLGSFVFKFLDLLENEPVLWNPKHPMYKTRTATAEAWERVQCGFPIVYTVDDLKKKKESLMAVFRTLLKKVKESITSGEENVYKPTWFAYNRMAKFLTPVYDGRPTIGLVAEDSREQQRLGTDTEADQQGYNPFIEHSYTPNFNQSTNNKNSKRKLASDDSTENQVPGPHKVWNSVNQKRSRKDQCDLYAELVANKLRGFDAHSRSLIMHEIDNVLFLEHNRQFYKRIKASQSQLPHISGLLPATLASDGAPNIIYYNDHTY